MLEYQTNLIYWGFCAEIKYMKQNTKNNHVKDNLLITRGNISNVMTFACDFSVTFDPFFSNVKLGSKNAMWNEYHPIKPYRKGLR